MKTIAFLNNKGGVGKTASVTTIAHIMATSFNKRVLIVDMDPQFNSSTRFSKHDWMTTFMSIYRGEKLDATQKNIGDLLLNDKLDPHEVIIKTEYENLDVLPAYLTLATVETQILVDFSKPQQPRLKNHLKKIENEYDYCLIDCSPSVSILNVNALVASDEVYLPVRTDGDSIVGMAISMNFIKEVQSYTPSLKLGGVFITQVNWQEGVAKTSYEFLQSVLTSEHCIPIQIGNTKLLKENSFEQKPLLEVDKGNNKSAPTMAYILLTEYIMAPNKNQFIKDNKSRLDELKHL